MIVSNFSYDHLAHCITKLITERTGQCENIDGKFSIFVLIEDAANAFEEISRHVKSEATRPQHDTLRDRPAQESEHRLAEEQKPLFEVNAHAREKSDSLIYVQLTFF